MLPAIFIERMKALLGDDVQAFLDAHNDPPIGAFRINSKKCSLSDNDITSMLVDTFSAERLSYSTDGYRFVYEKPGNHPLHHAGAIYIQEPSAMAPVSALEGRLPAAIKILDACASPGGKTSQIACMASSDSIIVSNEIIPSRCKTLVGNIERQGFRNTVILNTDTAYLSEVFKEEFALVICDAPCSGEGMFRKSEEAVSDWSEENVNMCASRQKEILDNLSSCVCDGGYLLYSTCTYAPEENEMNVQYFLDKHPQFSLCDPGEKFLTVSSCGIEKYCRTFDKNFVRRFYPHISFGEGQFFALFKKSGDLNNDTNFKQKDLTRALTKDEKTVAEKFLLETVGKVYDNIRAYGENIIILPKGMTVPCKHVFSCGVKLGEIRSGRIVPHHQFFSAYGNEFVNKISFSSDSTEINKYLRGEGFEVDSRNGWVAVLCDGISVGGAKVVDGYLKNHYPKGLRIMK